MLNFENRRETKRIIEDWKDDNGIKTDEQFEGGKVGRKTGKRTRTVIITCDTCILYIH